MKRIQKLYLRNFKAFADQPFDFKGHHALIYGGNGSGKSSIFWALYTFLQSAGKTTPEEVNKYFIPLRENGTDNYESLRHVFSVPQEESFIEVTWSDIPNTGSSTQRLGLDASGNDALGLPLTNAARTRHDPRTNSDNIFREANLGSDFIHYRFLQDFYQRTNGQEVNLLPVFVRDLFPFYQTAFFQDDVGQPEFFQKMLRDLLMEAHTLQIRRGKAKEAFIAKIEKANQDISQFVRNVRDRANAFLREQFLGGESSLQIELEYRSKLGFYQLRASPVTAVDREWRQDANNGLAIVLSVIVTRPGYAEITHFRPQSFLNEAQLTRVALAVRLGALAMRASNSKLKLLCLDDLLISLDMSNRRQVLDWLFSPAVLGAYQVVMLTHDYELHRMMSHYIDTRSKRNEWEFFELFMNEREGTSPYVPAGVSNNFVAQATDSYKRSDFRSSGNALRRFLEGKLKEFVPECYRYFENKGKIDTKELMALVQSLAGVYKLCQTQVGYLQSPLRDLSVYLSLHLNPLSHDHPITAIYQGELWRFIHEIVPALDRLQRVEKIGLDDHMPTRLELRLTDRSGIAHTYRFRLLEPLYLYTLPVFDSVANIVTHSSYSDPLCEMESFVLPSGLGFIISTPQDLEPVRLRSKMKKLCGPLRVGVPDLLSVLTVLPS